MNRVRQWLKPQGPTTAERLVLERRVEQIAAENAHLRLALEEIESFPISGYHAGAAQRMAREALAATSERRTPFTPVPSGN